MTDYALPNTSQDLTGQVLASCGAKVAITGRRVEHLEALAEELRASGAEVEPIAVDMRDSDAIVACV